MSVSFAHRAALTIFLACTLTSLAGCGMGVTAAPVAEPAGTITGTLYGGSTPIVGATISLMEAGITGYGSAPTVLSSAPTLVGGVFTLPVHSACTTPDRLVYLQAVGGNSGTNLGTNSAIDLVALVGTCSTSTATSVKINEATTIAAAYALAQFASVKASGTGIGTSSTNVLGLNNAFNPANLLANYTTGNANVTSTSAGIVLPTAVVNTLADILAACTNSASSTSLNCSKLFTNTTVNGVVPIDIFQAALNIALHPSANVANLFSLVSSTAPFQPTISTATPPTDYTLAIGFNGGGIAPQGVNSVAIDANGNAWVSDFYTNAASTTSGLIEITPSGTYPGGATGFGNGVVGPANELAIDEGGHIWLDVNSGTPTVTAFNPNGTVYTTITGVVGPNGIAIDATGDIWYSAGGNAYNTFQEIVNNGSGNYSLGTTVTAEAHFGVDVCITPTQVFDIIYGNNSESSAITAYTPSTAANINTIPDSGNSGLSSCAVDNNGNLYIADFGQFNGIEVYNSSLSLTHSYAVNQYVSPNDVVIDGLGNFFIATFIQQRNTAPYNANASNPSSLVALSANGTLLSPPQGYLPSTGQTNSNTSLPGLIGLTSQNIAPGGLAIDGSGNVWISGNDGQSVPSSGNVNNGNLPAYVTEVIGIAAPVVTPKATALANHTIATLP